MEKKSNHLLFKAKLNGLMDARARSDFVWNVIVKLKFARGDFSARYLNRRAVREDEFCNMRFLMLCFA